MFNSNLVDTLINLSIVEDLGPKYLDITSSACLRDDQNTSARILSKDEGVFFGHEVARIVFSKIDESTSYEIKIKDGESFSQGETIAIIKGRVKSILASERVVLNFIQRLSGVATITNLVCNKIKPYKTRILDSRKTTPGFRILEKAAVLSGGGNNHRMGLYDEFLIKNNHIDALGGNIKEAIKLCRKFDPAKKLKVEVRNSQELNLALDENPDGILLDNFDIPSLSESVKFVKSNKRYKDISLEASGGITINNVREYAETGVDEISLGALTHSAKNIDLSLHIVDE